MLRKCTTSVERPIYITFVPRRIYDVCFNADGSQLVVAAGSRVLVRRIGSLDCEWA